MDDIFNNGTPKYATAQSIYDALKALETGEEIDVLSQIVPDVSYDGQGYYYQDKGVALKEKLDNVTNYGYDFWMIDLAIFLLDESNCAFDVHDLVFDLLNNTNMASRVGFKKLFIDILLDGAKSLYDKTAEAFREELVELDCFDIRSNMDAFEAACDRVGINFYVNPYRHFSSALEVKLLGLRLDKERQLVVECRALLTSYDDFILGLRMNQELYEQQERQYNFEVAQLKAGYEQKINVLLAIAERHGLLPEVGAELRLLTGQREGQEALDGWED